MPVQHACTAGRARPPRALTRLPAAPGELQQQALTRLALQTLGSFDFGPARLLEFCRDHVVSYLDESDVATRRAAALAAAQVRARAHAPGVPLPRMRVPQWDSIGVSLFHLLCHECWGCASPCQCWWRSSLASALRTASATRGVRAPRNWPGHSH